MYNTDVSAFIDGIALLAIYIPFMMFVPWLIFKFIFRRFL